MIPNSNNTDPKRKTFKVSIDNNDLLQRKNIDKKPPTDLYREQEQNAPRGGMSDRVPTEHVERRPQRTVYVAPSGDMKPKLQQEQWLVGWLVVISGPMKGRSHTLSIGNNHVGRGSKNSIVLAEDPCISEESQVIVTYVKGKGDFYVTPSLRGTQTTMLNDIPLLSPQPLHERDVITLSDYTKLCFVSFCNNDFRWETLDSSTKE